MGMNCFRYHTSAATQIMNDAADELGFMTNGESAIRAGDKLAEVWNNYLKKYFFILDSGK
jgi:hypothetical protein